MQSSAIFLSDHRYGTTLAKTVQRILNCAVSGSELFQEPKNEHLPVGSTTAARAEHSKRTICGVRLSRVHSLLCPAGTSSCCASTVSGTSSARKVLADAMRKATVATNITMRKLRGCCMSSTQRYACTHPFVSQTERLPHVFNTPVPPMVRLVRRPEVDFSSKHAWLQCTAAAMSVPGGLPNGLFAPFACPSNGFRCSVSALR
jgi:hypothetical protein